MGVLKIRTKTTVRAKTPWTWRLFLGGNPEYIHVMPLQRLTLCTLMFAACVLLSLPGCGPSEPEFKRPNILLVSIDSLRSDHLGSYGYERDTSPFMDELAARGARFENAVSTTSWTLPAHAAMMTGLNDSTHGLVDNGLRLSDDHLTLAELLSSEGYRTAGFYGAPYLHPTFGMGQGYEVYQSCMSEAADDGEVVRNSARSGKAPSHADVTGPRTANFVKGWAATIKPGESWFAFVHLWDVHYDFIAPQEYVDLFDPDYQGSVDGRLMSNREIKRDMAPRDLAHVKALYDAEIRFTDDILRGIFEDLEARGMLDNTLIIVTSDHGEEFFEHGSKGHNKTLFEEVVRVPLFILWPGQIEAGRVIQDQAQIIDFMPTIANAVGCDATLAVQGRDLGPALAGLEMAPRAALLELSIDRGTQRALRTNTDKVIQPRSDAPMFWFDLANDPGEQRPHGPNAPPGSPEARSREAAQKALTAALERVRKFGKALARRGPDQIEVPDDVLQELQGLGYVGDQDE